MLLICANNVPISLHVIIMPVVGRIRTSSTHLVLWDLGGQEDLQTLWDKVCYVYTSIYLKATINIIAATNFSNFSEKPHNR